MIEIVLYKFKKCSEGTQLVFSLSS